MNDIENPYRRILLLETLNKIDSPHQQLIKLLAEIYPEFIKNMVDASTTAMVRSHGVKGFKGLFKKTVKKEDKRTGEIVVLKDGTRVRMIN